MKIPFKYSIVISLFFTINPCISQQMKYRVYDSSFSATTNEDFFQIEDSVYRSYKIERIFTPCLLTDSEFERIKKDREQNNRKLTRKYGVNWHAHIQFIIDSIERISSTKKENTFHPLAFNNDSLIDISIEINDSGNKIKVVKKEYNSANLSSLLPTLSGPDLKNPLFLYRGFQNTVQVDFGQCKQDFTVYCVKGTFDSIQLLSPSSLLLSFHVNSSSKKIPITLSSFTEQKTDTFQIKNLPVPSLFANEHPLDTILSKSNIAKGLIITCKNEDIELIGMDFQVIDWEVSNNEFKSIGRGGIFSNEALTYLQQLTSNQFVNFSFKIKSSDGITRKISRNVSIQE